MHERRRRVPEPGAARPVAPARGEPAQHELRGRQHLGQGDGDRSGHRHAGRAPVGQGLWRRPRDADRRGARGAAPRPAARDGRHLPGRRARGRDGRRVRLLPPRERRRGAVDRHGDARPGRCGARGPPPSRLRDRAGDGGRRRGADPRGVRGSRGLGRLAAARLPARPRHRRDPPRSPRGHRLHPRRSRDHRLGRDLRRVRGEHARHHRDRGTVHRRARPHGPVRSGAARLRAAPRRRAAGSRGGAAADRARPGLGRSPAGRALQRRPRSSSSSSPAPNTRGSPSSGRRARTTSCGRRSGRWCSTCRRPRRSRP